MVVAFAGPIPLIWHSSAMLAASSARNPSKVRTKVHGEVKRALS